MAKHVRNMEWRPVPGAARFKVRRDGDLMLDGKVVYNVSTITADDGTRMTVQMAIHKSFPDIPMRYTPSW